MTTKSQMKAYSCPIEKLPGLSEQNKIQLKACGINNSKQLLQKAGTVQLQNAIATQLQINVNYIKKWVALADLARLPNVGYKYCGVLLHSGIASVVQLAQTPPHRLHRQILKMQVATMQRRDLCPTIDEVQKWVEQAGTMSNDQ
ncbi:MAG: DUF4332 domain-containing protein [Spirulinaceae cyanobacterium]